MLLQAVSYRVYRDNHNNIVHSPSLSSSGIIATLSVYLRLGCDSTMTRVQTGSSETRKWRGITSPQRRGKGSPSGPPGGP